MVDRRTAQFANDQHGASPMNPKLDELLTTNMTPSNDMGTEEKDGVNMREVFSRTNGKNIHYKSEIIVVDQGGNKSQSRTLISNISNAKSGN